jgi:hypothetical protein
VPVLTTPGLLTWQQQRQLRNAWQWAFSRGRRRAQLNVAAAVRAGHAPPGSTPQEVDILYGFFEVGVPAVAREFASLFATVGRIVRVGGVFCHQTPVVTFRYLERGTKLDTRCELGDLLLVAHYRESWGEELDALLIQFKVGDLPHADSHDAQWRLYSEWPPFEWDLAPYYRRSPRPSGPHAGAIHAAFYNDSRRPRGRPADEQIEPRMLADLLNEAALLVGGRSIKSYNLARADAHAGWSEVVWDLIDSTARRLVNRQRSNVVGQSRSGGLLPILPDGSPPPTLLADAVVRAASGERGIVEAVWESAFRGDGDRFQPPALSRSSDDDESGAISVVAIEVAGQE